MRRTLYVVVLLCVAAAMAAAQGKLSSGWSCKPAPGHTYEVGDQPKHIYALGQFKCTATKGDFAGVKDKEGTGTEFDDIMGDKSTGHGTFVETLANGDRVIYSFTNTADWGNGKLLTGSNKWEIKGGTGKFKAVKGSGTCSGKGAPDGSGNWTCTGTYSGVK